MFVEFGPALTNLGPKLVLSLCPSMPWLVELAPKSDRISPEFGQIRQISTIPGQVWPHWPSMDQIRAKFDPSLDGYTRGLNSGEVD